MSLRLRYLTAPCAAAALLACGLAGAAELYRWVDDQGVVNYSNTPPARSRAREAPVVVDNRLSIYTPDRPLAEALERERERRARPAPAASFTAEGANAPRAPTAPPPPGAGPYDPCLHATDPACHTHLYDGSPVFGGRRRAPALVQPQIPPGTIAGQATQSGGYIAGQSASAPPVAPTSRAPSAGFTVREKEREPYHRR